jgi:hypothetical protein
MTLVAPDTPIIVEAPAFIVTVTMGRQEAEMTDEAPTPWVHGSDEDIISTIAYALRHEGKRTTR